MIGELPASRRTVVHRLPAGVKVGALALVAAGVFALDDARLLLAVGAAILGLFAIARVAPRTVGGELRIVAASTAFLLVLHLVFGDLRAGVVPALRLADLMLLSALVTRTTTVTAMVDLVVRVASPLARLGVDVERLALLLALAIRFVPVIAALGGEIRDAQRARGGGRDARVFAVPLLVRALRLADDVGDAIDARGGGPAARD